MPWVPTTDFEEEVVNLQPNHDFIYGALSEPQYNYPRPRAHIEYATSRKSERTQQQKHHIPNNDNKINGKLHVIQQVQRMAKTKPLGEQPTLDDWDNDKHVEQEIIGMIRHFGMGASVEQPLTEKVTIATHPVENTVKLVQNGRRKIALYFDDNVFKLKEKAPDTSAWCFESNNISIFNDKQNDCLASVLDSERNAETSFDNSFSTAGINNDPLLSVTPNKTIPSLQQYHKLLEDTAGLSLNTSSYSNRSSNSSHKTNYDSFKTADEEISSWKPISYEDENIFQTSENNFPVLSSKKNTSSDTTDSVNSETSVKDTSSSSNYSKRVNFLDSFIKTNNSDGLNTTASSSTASATLSSSMEPKTYATVTKTTPTKKPTKKNNFRNNSSDFPEDFQPFYTTRRMYALKRSAK